MRDGRENEWVKGTFIHPICKKSDEIQSLQEHSSGRKNLHSYKVRQHTSSNDVSAALASFLAINTANCK